MSIPVAEFVKRGKAAQRAADRAIQESLVKHDRDGLTKCRVCGCTELRPCFPPCGWEPGELDLCSGCGDLVRAIREWLEGAHRPSIRALMAEVGRQQLSEVADKADARLKRERATKARAQKAGGR